MGLKNFPNLKLLKFNEFDEVDEAFLEKSFETFFAKVGETAVLELSLKDYAKGGLRIQHEVKGNLKVGADSFFAEEKGWKLLTVITSVLATLERSARKSAKFKIEKHRKK